ncbi:MAG: hypothetical protein ABI323_00100 [Solirubrobacteraceae bacterium]
MATLENLPADQRAVLQLVLQRGRGYDEIARLLSMDRAAVRERALNAFDALGPRTGVGDQRRALLTDYLLGQLPPRVATEVRDHLAQTPSERAWARVLASELAPLSNKPMPEIPTSSALAPEMSSTAVAEPVAEPSGKAKRQRESILLRRRRKNAPEKTATQEKTATPVAKPAEEPSEKVKGQRESVLLRRRRKKQAQKAATDSPPPKPTRATVVPEEDDDSPRRSSRLGGAILLVIAVIAIVAVVALVLNKPSNKPHAAAAASTTATSTAALSGTTPTTSSAAKVVAQVNLKPTTKTSKAAGIAEVLKEGAADGIAIVAQNVPPNSTKPPNAYAVWLYNSVSDAHFLGFVNPGVGTNGRLSTAGGLPTNASHYKQLIVTVETISHPKTPGSIILAGPLTGL